MKPLYFAATANENGRDKFFVYPFPNGTPTTNIIQLCQIAHSAAPIEEVTYDDGPWCFVFERNLQRCYKQYNMFFDTSHFQLDYPQHVGEFQLNKEFWLQEETNETSFCISYYLSFKEEMARVYLTNQGNYHFYSHSTDRRHKRIDQIFKTEEEARERLLTFLEGRKIKNLLQN